MQVCQQPVCLRCSLQTQCCHCDGDTDSISAGFLMLSLSWSHLVDCHKHPTTPAHDSRHQCHCSTLQFKKVWGLCLQLFMLRMNKSWICSKFWDVLSEDFFSGVAGLTSHLQTMWWWANHCWWEVCRINSLIHSVTVQHMLTFTFRPEETFWHLKQEFCLKSSWNNP